LSSFQTFPDIFPDSAKLQGSGEGTANLVKQVDFDLTEYTEANGKKPRQKTKKRGILKTHHDLRDQVQPQKGMSEETMKAKLKPTWRSWKKLLDQNLFFAKYKTHDTL